MKTVYILGIPFDAMREGEAMRILSEYLNGDSNHVVVTPNPEGVMCARRDVTFQRALLDADLRFADGIGIVIASRLQEQNAIPNRLRGCDITQALFEAERGRARTVFLLGGAPGVAEQARDRIQQTYPGIRVIGCHDGYFKASEERIVVDTIRTSQPDILLVGTGMPKQELFAHQYRDLLGAKLTICVGGTIDILAGTVKRAPAVMRKLGLEWLARLIREPRRAKRMLDLPRFMMAAVKEAISGPVPPYV